MQSRGKYRLAAVLAAVCAGLMAASVLTSLDSRAQTRYTASGRNGEIPRRIALPAGTVDVNHGDLTEIMALPGVGEKIGMAVMEERALHWLFYYPEDLLEVRGIGEKTLSGFRDMLKLTDEER